MAFTDGRRIGWKQGQGSADRTRELLAAMLLGALITTLGLRSVLPTDALAPAIATLLFALGATTAGIALLLLRNQARTTWLNVAGLLTFVGIAVSILIDPDQLVRLLTSSNQTG
jgi:4-amino-4-deoxy-L-arabinose transferase-like glycosyltransferase